MYNNDVYYYIYSESILIHLHEIYIHNKRYPHSLRPNEYSNNKKFNDLSKNILINEKNIEFDGDIYIFLFDIDKACGGNYFHFCFHIMQKLYGYLILKEFNPNMKIVIREDLKEFQKELILKFVSEEDIVFLDVRRNWYRIKNCYIGNYISISSLPNQLFYKYQILSLEIYDYRNIKYNNVIFIKRNNKNTAGSNRYIINKEEYYDYLNKNNILITSFDNKIILDKIHDIVILSPKILIIETGSGLTNFFFFPKNILKNIIIIILNPKLWKIRNSRIYDIFKKLEIRPYIINCKSTINQEDKSGEKDANNNPFIINIKKLNELLFNLKHLKIER